MKKHLDTLIVLSVAVGMTVACGAWLYKPGQQELSTLLLSAKSMRDQLARGSGAVSSLAGVQSDVRDANQLLDQYKIQITPTPEVGAFLEQVSDAAVDLGLQHRAIVPKKPESQGSIVMLPIEISFASGFTESFRFLRVLEQLPRAVQVSQFSIKPGNGDRSPKGGAPLQTNMTLRIFYEAT